MLRIRSTRLLPYRLPLRRPWRTHHGVLTERSGWIVELTSSEGEQGYGDCAPLPAAGTETTERAHAWLQQHLSALPDQLPDEALAAIPTSTRAPAARHALETALLDLLSRTAGVPLRRWLSADALDGLAVNGAAGALDEQASERCTELIDQGFGIIKLKVGLAAVESELRLLQRLCRRLPAQVRLRLDANGAWSPAEALRFVDGLAGLAIESLEEPLAQPHPETLRSLQARTRIPLALDESLPRFAASGLLQRPPVRRLILKPPVLGGLQATLALAQQAHRAGLETLVTSTLESALGLQAAAQLAAALPASDPPLAQGLATGAWFAADLAPAPGIEQGRMQLPDAAGLGLRPRPEFIEKE